MSNVVLTQDITHLKHSFDTSSKIISPPEGKSDAQDLWGLSWHLADSYWKTFCPGLSPSLWKFSNILYLHSQLLWQIFHSETWCNVFGGDACLLKYKIIFNYSRSWTLGSNIYKEFNWNTTNQETLQGIIQRDARKTPNNSIHGEMIKQNIMSDDLIHSEQKRNSIKKKKMTERKLDTRDVPNLII